MRHVVIGFCICLAGFVVLTVIVGLIYGFASDGSESSYLSIQFFVFGCVIWSACQSYGFMVATNLASLPRFATKK